MLVASIDEIKSRDKLTSDYMLVSFFMPASLDLSVRSVVRYTKLMNTIFLKTNEQILLQIGTVGPRGKGMKRGQLRGSGGQRSEEETEVRSGGLADACLQHARMLDPFARVAFLVLLKTTSCL